MGLEGVHISRTCFPVDIVVKYMLATPFNFKNKKLTVSEMSNLVTEIEFNATLKYIGIIPF